MSAEKLGVLGKMVNLFSVLKRQWREKGLITERILTMQTLFPSCYVNAYYNLRSSHQSLSAIILRQEMISKGVERAILEAMADVVDKLDDKALVVDRQ